MLFRSPSLDERLAELAATEPLPAPAPVRPPPPLIPLIYRPGPRISRPRSASPTFETDLSPRPSTVPLVEPVIFDRPVRRPPPRPRTFRPPPLGQPVAPSEPPSEYPEQQPTASRTFPLDYGGMRTTTPGTVRPESEGPDMLREVQRRRQERRGGDGTFIPGRPQVSACISFKSVLIVALQRVPSAPPDLGQRPVPPPGQSWYTQPVCPFGGCS